MNNYDDIINLAHPVSRTHPQMSMANRAAQFDSFAALNGFEEEISKVDRIVSSLRMEANVAEELNRSLSAALASGGEIKITFFQYDKNKNIGRNLCVNGRVKKIDDIEKVIILEDNTVIPLSSVIEIEADVLDCY